jgi:hypothetical protein
MKSVELINGNDLHLFTELFMQDANGQIRFMM